MNDEQIKTSVRWFIATFGGMIAGWGAHAGWLNADQILAILNSQTFIGIAVGAAGLVWGLIARTKFGLIFAAAQAIKTDGGQIVIKDQSAANDLPSNVKGPTEAVVVPPSIAAARGAGL